MTHTYMYLVITKYLIEGSQRHDKDSVEKVGEGWKMLKAQ